MASPTERIRAFRGDRRSKVAIRSIIRGDSIWLRGLLFVIMSAIFFLLVTLTKRNGLQTQSDSASDSTEVDSTVHTPVAPRSAPTAPPSRTQPLPKQTQTPAAPPKKAK